MDFLEIIKSRKSVRKFKKGEISKEKIEEILKCAISAPSAGNLQPWIFIVVEDNKIKQELASAALNQKFIAEASVVIVACANIETTTSWYGERGNLYYAQDVAAAVENILIAAHALGLGACWVGAFYENEVSKILNLPENIRPLAIVPIGYPEEKAVKPERKPLMEVAYKNRYGIPWS